MQCEADGCSATATVHLQLEDRSALHLCEVHAVAMGWVDRSPPDDPTPPRDLQPSPAPDDLLRGGESWPAGQSKSSALRSFQDKGFVVLSGPSGKMAVLYAKELATTEEHQEFVSRCEFTLNLPFERYFTDRAAIEAWLASLPD